MFSRSLSDRVETLIDELIEEGGLASGSLASILLAARDAVQDGYGLELSHRVLLTLDELRLRESSDPGIARAPRPGDGRKRSRHAI
jgi:hypothetical protein